MSAGCGSTSRLHSCLCRRSASMLKGREIGGCGPLGPAQPRSRRLAQDGVVIRRRRSRSGAVVILSFALEEVAWPVMASTRTRCCPRNGKRPLPVVPDHPISIFAGMQIDGDVELFKVISIPDKFLVCQLDRLGLPYRVIHFILRRRTRHHHHCQKRQACQHEKRSLHGVRCNCLPRSVRCRDRSRTGLPACRRPTRSEADFPGRPFPTL